MSFTHAVIFELKEFVQVRLTTLNTLLTLLEEQTIYKKMLHM